MTDDPLGARKAERIDHHGRPAKWFMDYPGDYLDALVAEMKAIELILLVEFGLQPFLTFGTLLGAIREGDLIGHDSDIDLSYVSRFDAEADILAERAEILALFKAGGRAIGRPSHGRFMLRSVPTPRGKIDHGIELFTSFLRDGRYYGYNSIAGTLAAGAVLPLGTAMLRGVSFSVPRDPAAFLEKAIAPDWRVPKLPKDHQEELPSYPCFDFLYPRFSL